MEDSELIKLAGIAAGCEYTEQNNPLNDDALALRLAVKLAIVPRNINGTAFAWCDGICETIEPHNGDLYAATRRAIVRAAAEIGRGIARHTVDDVPEDNYYKTQAEAEDIGRAAAEIGKALP